MVRRSKEKILYMIYKEIGTGSPTIYEINKVLNYDRICVVRKYLRVLVNTGSVQTAYNPEKECTIFTIKN